MRRHPRVGARRSHEPAEIELDEELADGQVHGLQRQAETRKIRHRPRGDQTDPRKQQNRRWRLRSGWAVADDDPDRRRKARDQHADLGALGGLAPYRRLLLADGALGPHLSGYRVLAWRADYKAPQTTSVSPHSHGFAGWWALWPGA